MEGIHSRSEESRPIIKVRETTFNLDLRWFGNEKGKKQVVRVKMNIVANSGVVLVVLVVGCYWW